jgi:DNA-binding transcriptional regulator YbjK
MPESAERAPAASQRTPAATRRRVRAIDAFVDLVLEGNLPPTAEQVAERAGISMATFFRYFETFNALRDDAVALIAMLTSVESWEQFRLAYGRSPLQTRRTWAQAIEAVLSGGNEG